MITRSTSFLFDLDGTIYEGDQIIPGAEQLLRKLQERNIPHCFITNTTRMPRREVAGRLRTMGCKIEEEQIYTAPVAAASWLRERGYHRVALVMEEATHEDLAEFDITQERPDAIVVGDLGERWNFRILDKAFRMIMDGADLVALQKNRYWKGKNGVTLDAGPFVAALEYASGREAVIVGKPSYPFFAGAAGMIDSRLEDCVMVGDDLHGDVEGAQKAGARGILVRTGKFREEELEKGDVQPDMVIDSVASLVDMV